MCKSINDKNNILRNYGKLKNPRKSISYNLPQDLARRRKELLAYGYSLRTSASPLVKVAETRVISKGINIWLEATKNSKAKNWTRAEETCFDTYKIFAYRSTQYNVCFKHVPLNYDTYSSNYQLPLID